MSPRINVAVRFLEIRSEISEDACVTVVEPGEGADRHSEAAKYGGQQQFAERIIPPAFECVLLFQTGMRQ